MIWQLFKFIYTAYSFFHLIEAAVGRRREIEMAGKLILNLVTNFMSTDEQKTQRTAFWWQTREVSVSEKLLNRLESFAQQPNKISISDQLMNKLKLASSKKNGYSEYASPFIWIGLTLGVTLGAYVVQKRIFRRFKTAMDIPPEYFKQNRIITGRVVAVNDTDNLRIIHYSPLQRLLSFIPFSGLFLNRKIANVKYETINVRLAGIDAPEMGHFGGKPQPLAPEALEWLKKRTLHRTVHVRLMRLDQYSRAVCLVHTTPQPFLLFWWWHRHVNVEMVREGLACVYRLGGKEYGASERTLEAAERDAKRRRKGIWGLKNLILPSEYKKQTQ